jgi:hypothetical protein
MRKIELKLNKKNKKTGLKGISLVEHPATKTNFILLSEENQEKQQIFHFSEDDKQILTGVLLKPNQLIYRSPESLKDGLDGYIYFSEETIQDTCLLFLQSENLNKITLEHSENIGENDINLMEIWLVSNPEMDKSKALGFENLPINTLMVSLKINNPQLWQEIKTGKYKGFSIEGFFDYDENSITELSEIKENKEIKNELIEKIMEIIKDEIQLIES